MYWVSNPSWENKLKTKSSYMVTALDDLREFSEQLSIRCWDLCYLTWLWLSARSHHCKEASWWRVQRHTSSSKSGALRVHRWLPFVMSSQWLDIWVNAWNGWVTTPSGEARQAHRVYYSIQHLLSNPNGVKTSCWSLTASGISPIIHLMVLKVYIQGTRCSLSGLELEINSSYGSR